MISSANAWWCRHRGIPIHPVENATQSPAMCIAFHTALAPSGEAPEALGDRRDRCFAQNGSIRGSSRELRLFLPDGICEPHPELAVQQQDSETRAGSKAC